MIQIKNIKFGYNRWHSVLDEFSLEFREGGVYGLLGKNGTGKSTLLYLMAGLLRPQKGSVLIDGVEPQERDPRLMQDLFLVPEEYDLPHVTLKEYVESLRPFYPRFSNEILERCLAGFDMNTDLHLGSLSMGQKKKVYMCVALATNTRYLLMDEPTNGLDILSKSQFRKVIISGMTDEKTILISTHQVHDVEHLLDHVTIIDRNRVLLNQPLSEDEGPVDLEQLFISTLQNPQPVACVQSKDVSVAPLDDVEDGWCKRLLKVARWDLTVNRSFYTRVLAILVALTVVPMLVHYMNLLFGFFSFNVGGTELIRQEDISGLISFYQVAATGFIPLGMMAYMFHNLLTRQGRISELTLPADNMTRFVWHALMVLAGTQLACLVALIATDLVHVLLAWSVVGKVELQSVVAGVYSMGDFRSMLPERHPVLFAILVNLMCFNFMSTFALGNAWKYRYNLVMTWLGHIALGLTATTCLGFLASFVVGHEGMAENMQHMLLWLDNLPDMVIASALVILALALTAGIWWLTYRLYCRAQITTRRNP